MLRRVGKKERGFPVTDAFPTLPTPNPIPSRAHLEVRKVDARGDDGHQRKVEAAAGAVSEHRGQLVVVGIVQAPLAVHLLCRCKHASMAGMASMANLKTILAVHLTHAYSGLQA